MIMNFLRQLGHSTIPFANLSVMTLTTFKNKKYYTIDLITSTMRS